MLLLLLLLMLVLVLVLMLSTLDVAVAGAGAGACRRLDYFRLVFRKNLLLRGACSVKQSSSECTSTVKVL
jgi:hypothetical protein